MNITLLKSKIHRATVTETELGYMGSISVDSRLLEAAGFYEHEKALVVDVDNGNRFETYCLKARPNSGVVCLNGAAARLVSRGDKVIIMSFAQMTPQEAESHKPKVVFVDDGNVPLSVSSDEADGRISV
ncbi:MAG: aspartate 1-decarboxylase [Deltaproteobacteria bacterium]|nr:aspartate 1-decarboxylase [Deltaproteobacteria bacterium]